MRYLQTGLPRNFSEPTGESLRFGVWGFKFRVGPRVWDLGSWRQ